MASPFLRKRPVAAEIRSLARAKRITVFAGAGVGTEAGLPDWFALVRELLLSAPSHQRTEASVRTAWADAVLAQGLPQVAAVAAALHHEVLGTAVARELSRLGGLDDAAPGPIAEQIALIKDTWGRDARIITTNYDPLIESALRRNRPARLVRSYIVGRRAEPNGVASVTHLHGHIVNGQPNGQLVLSEEDYHLMQDARAWQEVFVAELLRASVCVFVGASFTDPNLIRYLYRHGHGGRHVALFARQGETTSPDLRGELERSASARWARCGVTPLFADYFSEVAQFLHEMVRQRTMERAYVPYARRQSTWRQQFVRKVVRAEASNSRFGQRQRDLASLFDAWVQGVRAIAAADSVSLEQEELGLALWGVDYGSQEMYLWASTNRVYRRPKFKRVALEAPSVWVAVESVSRGAPVTRDPENYASRWRLVRAVPIYLDLPSGRIIAGCLTLASTTPSADSALLMAPGGTLQAIDAFLQGRGAMLLSI